MLLLAAHQANLRQTEEMRAAFLALDKNGDGTLNKDELVLGLRTLEKTISQEACDSIFQWIDSNSNAKLDYSEWLCATLEPTIVSSATTVKELFDFLDSDLNGKVSKEELVRLTDDLDEATEVLRKCDTSHDGLIDFEEFKSFMDSLATVRSGRARKS